MNEGPHVDLVDWKHHQSKWNNVEPIGKLSFVSQEFSSDEFPSVTNQEIVAAVTETLKKLAHTDEYLEAAEWIRLANQCASPTKYPCGVSVSKVRLRISVNLMGEWVPIQTIEMIVPMGC